MSNKKKTTKKLDLEAERKKLLATMDEHISADTKSKIEVAVKSLTKINEVKVSISQEGAGDANNK